MLYEVITIFRYPVNQKLIAQRMQNIIAFNTAIHCDCQTLTTVFVNKCQDFYRPAIMGAIHHKII